MGAFINAIGSTTIIIRIFIYQFVLANYCKILSVFFSTDFTSEEVINSFVSFFQPTLPKEVATIRLCGFVMFVTSEIVHLQKPIFLFLNSFIISVRYTVSIYN